MLLLKENNRSRAQHSDNGILGISTLIPEHNDYRKAGAMKVNHKHILLVGFFLLILAACTVIVQESNDGFADSEPEEYVRIMPVVREYFYLRKQAVITGDMTAFIQHYPQLSNGMDAETGINVEPLLVASMTSMGVIDGNLLPEYYESIKIRQHGTIWEVLAHGMELYLFEDQAGKLNESGGEFKIVLLMREENDAFEIYQTDEVTLPEWKDFDQ